jgi:hypothetical protein
MMNETLKTILSLVLVTSTAQAAEDPCDPGEGQPPLCVRRTIQVEEDSPREHRVLSPIGPSGSAFSLGLASIGSVPALQLRFVIATCELGAIESSIETIGAVQHARAGLRYRLFGDERASLAARVSVVEYHSFRDFEEELRFGAGPGVVVALGDERIQWTIGFDVAATVIDNDHFTGIGEAFEVRPSFGVEAPLTSGVNVVAEAGAILYLTPSGGAGIPAFSAGVSW